VSVGPGPTDTNPNTVSRLALSFAILFDHTLSIDRFAALTTDRAVVDGHAFLDKVPGQSLVAVPVVALAAAVAWARDIPVAGVSDGQLTRFFRLCAWLVIAATSAPFAAAAAASVYRTALRLGASEHGAIFAGLTLGIATPAFGWGTVLFSHMMAAGCLMLVFEALLVITSAEHTNQLLPLATGAGMAFAATIEITAAVPVLLMAVMAVSRLKRGGAHGRRMVACTMLGGLLGALPLAVYNHVAFGSPLSLGYGKVDGFEGMERGFFGISLPSAWVFMSILIAPRRGIVWLSPVLAAIPWAWWVITRRWPAPVAGVLVAIPLFYLLLNAGYFYWDGGASTGPRHIVAALPFVCLPLAPLWDGASGRQQAALLAATVVSCLLSVVCATVDMTATSKIVWVLNQVLLPRFMAGDVHNIFALAGLPGLWSVLPVMAITGLLVGLLSRQCRRAARAVPMRPRGSTAADRSAFRHATITPARASIGVAHAPAGPRR
jgi:hypothetical protein